jgi:hypothetical protein
VGNYVLQQEHWLYHYKGYKYNSLVVEAKMLMIITIHVEGAYVTWKSRVRFMRFMDQPNTNNIKNSNIGVPLEFPSPEFYSQEENQSVVDNHD